MSRGILFLEFIFICAASLAVSAAYIFLLDGPNLTLLFDGFGYLTITQGCMAAFNCDLLSQIVGYCSSGFPESMRLSLCQKLAPANGLVRSGPLLPILLSGAYLISGKPPTPQFWYVGTWAMWLTQALTIALVWLSARLAFNPQVARIAALIALTYPAFIINGNRISTETQACLGVTLGALVFIYLGRKEFDQSKTVLSGFLCGLPLGFLALARPPFLILPVLVVVALSITARLLKLSMPFNRRWAAGVLGGAAILLAPWALCNLILTGKPSIAIDRYAVYNLYTGLNAKTIGFDTLPSELVEHPERFKASLGEALAGISHNASSEPSRFLEMIALKPARLLDSPWNDCQVSCYGIPWLYQRFAHQLVLTLALFGIFSSYCQAIKARNWSTITPAIVLSSIVLYNFIHLLFISMGRYTYPIMPVIIILAGCGLHSLWSQGKNRLFLLGLAVLVPLASLVVESASTPACSFVPQMAASAGVNTVALLVGILVSVGLPVFIFKVSKQAGFGKRTICATTSVAIACSAFAFMAALFGVRQSVVPIACNSRENSIVVSVPVPATQTTASAPSRDWLIVIDPSFQGFSLDALNMCRFAVNGVEIHGDLVPLLLLDNEERSSAVYSKAFSHSGHKDVTGIRQWFAIAVPPHLVSEGKSNSISLRLDETDAKGSSPSMTLNNVKAHILCDIVENGRDVAPLSLREFSWSKGFTTNPPLDMRMPADASDRHNYANELEVLSAAKVKPGNIRPRIYLLAVDGQKSFAAPLAKTDTIEFGDIAIGRGQKERVATLTIDPGRLSNVSTAIKNGLGNAVKLKISGRVEALPGAESTKKTHVSIGAITNIVRRTKSKPSAPGKPVSDCTETIETMSPLAPELITAPAGGAQAFSFVDIIPALNDADGKATQLPALVDDFKVSIRLLVAGKPWWDVLQYANYKVDAPVAVKGLKLEASVTTTPSLGRQAWHLFLPVPLQK